MTVQGECPRCTLLCSTAISGHRFLPSLCFLLSRPTVPWKNCHVHSWSWSTFQLVRRGEKCGGSMPTPRRSGTSSVTPYSVHSPLDWQSHLWLDMESALVLRRKWKGILVDRCRSPLSFPFLFLILFSFQTSRLHSAKKIYFLFFPYPPLLPSPAAKLQCNKSGLQLKEQLQCVKFYLGRSS